jgi:hypothetical protein
MFNTTEEELGEMLQQVPELRPRYEALVEAWGEQVSANFVLEELVDLLAPMLSDPSANTPVLERAIDAVEHLAISGEDGEDAVAYGFLEALPPMLVPSAMLFLGPRTQHLLDALDDGTLDDLDEDDPDSEEGLGHGWELLPDPCAGPEGSHSEHA